jgi:PAS domain S-box-containing protein
MKNLLNSTDIAIVFLDNSLHVRRFTNSATRIIKLIPSDVGRPLSDIVTDLDYPRMHQDAKEVLRTLVFSEKEKATRDGKRWFLVRIMPYRTADNVIDGVVITFVDVTAAKVLEARLRDALKQRGAAME